MGTAARAISLALPSHGDPDGQPRIREGAGAEPPADGGSGGFQGETSKAECYRSADTGVKDKTREGSSNLDVEKCAALEVGAVRPGPAQALWAPFQGLSPRGFVSSVAPQRGAWLGDCWGEEAPVRIDTAG